MSAPLPPAADGALARGEAGGAPDGRRYTILHVTAPGNVGGLERVVHALAIGQHRRGHRVHVAAIVDARGERHPFVAPLVAEGVTVEVIALPPRSYRRERAAVRALCERLRPDVVHTHGDRPDVVHVRVGSASGAAMVTTLHGSSKMAGIGRLYDWLHERAHRYFDGVVSVSRALTAETLAKGVPRAVLHTVPNAWSGGVAPLSRDEARRRLDLPRDARVLGWVGRLIPVKGGDVFVRAMAALGDPAVIAIVIGGGPERARCEALAASLGVAGRMRFVGAREDAAPLFPAFDRWVSSSRSEGTPITLFEAMASGVPVVSTAVGGVPDVISENESWLAPSEDAAALAAAIRASLADDAEAARRAEAARERLAAEFGAERWLARYDDVYAAAAAHARR
jgi:glycosyltransferase involved in cell wall biosynthesis